MSERYVGLMSGTSIDGVDGVLVEASGSRVRVLAHSHRAFDDALRNALLSLNTSGHDELHRAALAANTLARHYAEVVTALRAQSAGPVRAIGAHGQTVRHRPGLFDGTGYTLQINAPALLAELTGIDVVADFRSRDVAAGGQGAPLAPAFHRVQFGRADRDMAVVNVGGMANVSFLPADGPVTGHDCGPGNALMDSWSRTHLGTPYDDGGAWAAGGKVVTPLLDAALAHPYFSQRPPKSTGRDDFHRAWLDELLAAQSASLLPRDVQATLCELTAQSIARDIASSLPAVGDVVVCGGGAFNRDLLRRLRLALPGARVASSDEHGVPPLEVEAAAFAWLAWAHVHAAPGNLPSVSGAAGPRRLGALYPA